MCVKKKLCDVINRIAEAYRKEQSLRKSKLSIRETIHILIGAEGGSLAKELHRTGYDVSASALTQRRAQIPANVFRDIFMGFNGECVDSETFHGFRLLAVDGTAVSIPRNPKSDSFVVHSGAPKGSSIRLLGITPKACYTLARIGSRSRRTSKVHSA